jgi:hypothetical protein
MRKVILSIIAISFLSSCVGTKKYKAQVASYEKLKSEFDTASSQLKDCDTEKENITNLQNEPFQYNSERPVTPPNNKIKKRKPPSQKKIYIEAKKKKE